MGHPLWPIRDLVVRTPVLELRMPDDAELCALAALARAGLHTSGPYPFLQDWLTLDSPDYERGFYRYHHSVIAGLRPEAWNLELAVFVDGEPAGFQGAFARDFPTLRVADTGSWLGAGFQRRGLGTEMREAILHLLFEGLGAETAASASRIGNEGSIGVSRRLGYRENGRHRITFGDGPAEEIRWRLDRAEWEPRRRDDIELLHLTPCLPDFGLVGDQPAS